MPLLAGLQSAGPCQSDFPNPVPKTTLPRNRILRFPADNSPSRLHHSRGPAKGGYNGRSIASAVPASRARRAEDGRIILCHLRAHHIIRCARRLCPPYELRHLFLSKLSAFCQNSRREPCTPHRNGPCCPIELRPNDLASPRTPRRTDDFFSKSRTNRLCWRAASFTHLPEGRVIWRKEP